MRSPLVQWQAGSAQHYLIGLFKRVSSGPFVGCHVAMCGHLDHVMVECYQ